MKWKHTTAEYPRHASAEAILVDEQFHDQLVSKTTGASKSHTQHAVTINRVEFTPGKLV